MTYNPNAIIMRDLEQKAKEADARNKIWQYKSSNDKNNNGFNDKCRRPLYLATCQLYY